MHLFEANIGQPVIDFFNEKLRDVHSFEVADQILVDAFGIERFFGSNEELAAIKTALSESNSAQLSTDRAEFGDFQTNENLANEVVLHLISQNISPKIIVEPTCGKGNFIIACLKNFTQIEHIYGIEIYKPYVWETKFNLIAFFLNNPELNKIKITIAHCSVFDHDFNRIAKQFSDKSILLIGNPPWVTNSMLGSLNSSNLPKKTNFKHHSGLDAMTGKGNFDIAESITTTMIKVFQKMDGHLVLLVKNSVIKNLVFDQYKSKHRIGEIEKHSIDSKKEFNVSVEASLFFCKLNVPASLIGSELDFYNKQLPATKFGWFNDKFVSNIDTYLSAQNMDGTCPFVWRQGLKHDCSTIMELDKVNGHYVNGLNEAVKLEDGLVFGLLKSSDLKNTVIDQTRKFTIVTQKKIGQETNHIKYDYPQTYQYLIDHQPYFEARKSSIYNNKPLFSIFGIGDYSFKPFKVAISGLYKTFHFTLILPQADKPVMLDDTCYLVGFDRIEFAVYALILLNSETTVKFLQSITFSDAKRTFTKDVLMRIDLLEMAKNIDREYLQTTIESLNEKYKLCIDLGLWPEFISGMQPVNTGQFELFA